jgi:hypothetical protein
MTKRENYAIIKGIVETSDVENKEDILAFIEHEVELLDNKRSKDKETAAVTEELGKTIRAILATYDEPVSISELLRNTDIPSTYTVGKETKVMSAQKLTYIVGRLEGVVRTEVKGKPYYSVEV